MQTASVQQIIKDRRAGPAARLLSSAAGASMTAQERLQLEAVALPLLSEADIENKWLGWLASPAVPFSLLVQQLAKRLVSLPEDGRAVFAEKLHRILQEALKQGKIQPGPKEKLEEHQIIFDLLAPHIPLLAAPTAVKELPASAVPVKPRVSEKEETKPLERPIKKIMIRRPAMNRTVPPPQGLPIEDDEPERIKKDQRPSPVLAKRTVPPKPQLEELPEFPAYKISPAKKPLLDIRPPATLGPIDELRTISIQDFRRLGDTASERVKKIETMIDTAGRSELKSRREAILAWIDSPVMQLQRSIGFSSLQGEQALEAEILRREKVGQPTLTKDEFEALADLAERLGI